MAMTMDPGSLRDLSAPNSARQADSSSGPPPFSNSRLRGYAGRVEGLLDPKLVLSSSVALTGAGMADPFPAIASPGTTLLPPRGFGPSQQAQLHAQLQQLQLQQQAAADGEQQQQYHARFAAAPAVFSQQAAAAGGGGAAALPQRFSPRSTGQGAPPPPAPAAAWPPPPVSNPEDLAAALSQIQSLKAEIAGVETVLGYLKSSETATTTMGRKAHKLPSQEQLRARADALGASRAASRLGGGGELLLSPLRGAGAGGYAGAADGPARARSAGEATSGGAAAAASQRAVYDTLVAETKLGRTWGAPRGPQPVGRGEAVILESALNEALPPGAITAKYGSGVSLELSFWSGGDVRKDFEMLDMVQREVARQVSVSCVERGRIIDKLADRQSEIFVALAAAAKAAAEAQRGVTDQLAGVRARAVEQASEIAALRSELAAQGADSEDLREQLAEACTAHEHYVWDTEQEVEQLQGQADILAAEVEHLHVRLAEAVAEKDAALSRGLERLEGDLEAVTDERDDLAQRIRFLERQLHKLRTEMNASVATSVAEVQTDPVEWGPVEEEDIPDDCSDTPSLAEIRARFAAQGYGALTPEERIRLGLPPHVTEVRESKGRKRRRALGHFEGLISSEKPGRVRGAPWTINAISAIYYDKVQADAVSDREGNPRLRLAEFAVEWHMTRFGLRNLAELNLLDLIASVRQHYRASVRIRWFGQFTGLVEVGDQVDSTPHVSFYLMVLTQLAAPNSLVSLFPDSGGEDGAMPPVAIKATVLPEATKAVFRYLNELDGAVPFLARAVDPLTDPDSQLVPLDPLVALFMAEYQKRWERNSAHLRALFRAGDYDDDGYIGYDEFVAIVRQLMPDCGERTCAKMYGEAMRRLPDGQSLVDVETFLSVARAFGWDRWRVDPGGPASTSAGGGSRSPPHWSFMVQQPSSAGGHGGGGGIVSRSASVASRGVLAAAASAASAGSMTAPYGSSRAVSNLRREDSVVGLSDADRTLLRVLDGALEGLDPPLEEQVTSLLDRLRSAVAAASQQAASAAAAAAALPGLELGPAARELNSAMAMDHAMMAKLEAQYGHFRAVYGERTDPAAAWLTFRLLLASLAAATVGARARTSHSRSRPGSEKGAAGWSGTRTVMRLTIPSLPFRSGSGFRALAGGSASPTSRTSPLHTGQGMSPYPGYSSSAGGVGEGSFSSGTGLAPPPQRPRSASRSPDLPGRPTALAQMIQAASSPSPLNSGSFSDRPTLVIPSATGPVPLHRTPLPATASARASVASTPTPTPTPHTVSTPSKRGVVFSLGHQQQQGAAAVGAPAAPAALSLSAVGAPAAPTPMAQPEAEASQTSPPPPPPAPAPGPEPAPEPAPESAQPVTAQSAGLPLESSVLSPPPPAPPEVVSEKEAPPAERAP